MKNISFLLLIYFFAATTAWAQFPPPAGQAGTTAIYKDSSIFKNWATGCTVTRGYQDISDPSSGYATAGDESMATGKSGAKGTVSLGDGGFAVLTFAGPVINGQGWDFAVFENAFDDYFLELAFVEVSSDGQNFYRFPATSLTDTAAQINSFGPLDATKLNNLAGKYRLFHGTPFDLEEMINIPGLDVNHITHIKIIDVVGSLGNQYATRDALNNKVNDPWPTPFPSAGFDLDAVGVIHQVPGTSLVKEPENFFDLGLFPNPAKEMLFIQYKLNESCRIKIKLTDISGTDVLFIEDSFKYTGDYTVSINISAMSNGLYFFHLITGESIIQRKILIRK